jgi:hypothetical protein
MDAYSPEDVYKVRLGIPDIVIECVNKMLVENFKNDYSAKIYKKKLISLINATYQAQQCTRKDFPIEDSHFEFNKLYSAKGWYVNFRKNYVDEKNSYWDFSLKDGTETILDEIKEIKSKFA